MKKQKTKNRKFEERFYKIIIVILILFSLLLFILSFYLNEDFFIKSSPDKELKDSTLGKIQMLQYGLLALGTFCLFLLFLSLCFRNGFKLFIKKHQSFLKGLTLLIITLIILILISEIILRIIFINTTSYGYGPGILKFNRKYIYLNNDDMRDRNFEINKSKGIIRIAGIGDSVTFGSGVKNINDTYLKVLETKLNLESKKYEILNFGLPGKNTKDELDILNKKALKYDPDILIIGYFINDFINVDSNITEVGASPSTIPYIGFWLRNSLYSYYFIEIKINKFLENTGFKKVYEKNLIEIFHSDINKEYNNQLFREIKEVASNENITTMMVIFPMIYELEDYPFIQAHKVIKEIAEKNDFFVLDLLDTYEEYDESELILSKYDLHPNEFTHSLIADKIFEELKKN